MRRNMLAPCPSPTSTACASSTTEQGTGEPLLCVMGLASDHRAGGCSWRRSPSASGRSCSTTATSAGRRSCDADYDIADLADDALALADHLGLDASTCSASRSARASRSASRLRIPTASARSRSPRPGRVPRTPTARCAPACGSARSAARTPEEWLEEMMLLTLSENVFETQEGVDDDQADGAREPPPAADGRADPPDPLDVAPRRARPAARAGMPVHVIAGDRDLLIPPWKSEEVAEYVDDAPHRPARHRPLDEPRARGRVQRRGARLADPTGVGVGAASRRRCR